MFVCLTNVFAATTHNIMLGHVSACFRVFAVVCCPVWWSWHSGYLRTSGAFLSFVSCSKPPQFLYFIIIIAKEIQLKFFKLIFVNCTQMARIENRDTSSALTPVRRDFSTSAAFNCFAPHQRRPRYQNKCWISRTASVPLISGWRSDVSFSRS